MFKKIILITALLLSQSFAGQSNNEAEFERLYFEYHNNLIDGADYDVIMQLAVMLHKLAPQVYGKNSANTAEVTYNLARLLDETGGKEFNANELMSTQLYQEYFSILDNINAPKDKKYLEQYIQFLRSETNSMFLFISDENLKKGIRISKRMKLDNSDKGDVEFNFAGIYASRSDHKNARKYYKKSIQSYNQEHGNSHYTIAASLIEMLKLDLKEINQYIVTAQNDLLYKRRTAEKKIIRKARKLLTLAEEKVVKITPMLINQNENSPRLSDSFIQAKETVDDYHDKFSTHAYSDEVYKFAKKQVHSDSEEKSEYTITPIVRKNPIYPNRAAKTGLEGYVLSQFDIELDGTTSNIRVVESSHDIFIRYALYATSKYLYETPMINGLPSKIKNVTVRVDFNLKNNDEQKEGDQI